MPAQAGCPPDVLELLPWYPEGTLGEAERGRVEAHAAECAACRHELDLIEGGAEPAPGMLPDRELLWARTLARIAQAERAPAPAPIAVPRARGWSVPLAAAAGLLLALAAGLWAGSRLAREPAAGGALYTPAAEQPEGDRARELDVVFRPEATALAIGSALRDLDAGIVAGPSPVTGFYRVRLADPGRVASAAQKLREGVASFAEPLPQ
jgi:hypothetical protein